MPEEFSFDRLVQLPMTAFGYQDGMVDPPSSVKSVNISEQQWRFARDGLFLAQDKEGNTLGQVWIEDPGKDAYLYKLSFDPLVKGGRHWQGFWSRRHVRFPRRTIRKRCALMSALNLSITSRFSNHAGLKFPVKAATEGMNARHF
ncbi:hypothetical protein [Thalassospira lucentensis]|uniref:hypothetical protein n=1 Tax=Thalassospira lucentensis TaxID=168935 RepID=UPI003AA9710B